jgi:DNA-binding FrmR family transcriptional regulator
MKHAATHDEQLQFLKRISGQIAGIQRMIEQKRYCVDILTQIRSCIGALHRVELEIFRKHLDACVLGALKGKSMPDIQKKIDEVVKLAEKFGRA